MGARMKIVVHLDHITCNAPMPALPRVHMDGATANAFANAFLFCRKQEENENNLHFQRKEVFKRYIKTKCKGGLGP